MKVVTRIDNASQRSQELEDKLRMPVVVSKSGTAYVVDLPGGDARVLSRADLLNPKRLAGLNKGQGKRSAQKRYPVTVRLFLRYPGISFKSVDKVIRRLARLPRKLVSIHVIIETGISPPDWKRLQKFATGIFDLLVKLKIRSGIIIEGVFSRPDKRIMDWLVMRRILTRFVLGPSLGYPADLKGDNAKALSAMSEYGLRIPVLFYWSGQDAGEVAGLLKKALRLNKLGGAGILPHYVSPRFDCRNHNDCINLNDFSDMLAFLYADKQLAEFIEEPVSEIEQRLAGPVHSRYINAIVTKSGEILGFRRFAFAAGRISTEKLQLKVPMSGRCERCVWKRLCGGVDRLNAGTGRLQKSVTESWCLHQKKLMRRVTGECLDLREYLDKIKNKVLKDAG
jgi:hypothetical protein